PDPIPESNAASSVESFGGENSPRPASASSAPLPGLVGISETVLAPQSNAKPTDRSAQWRASDSVRKGGLIKMKTRSAISFFRRNSAAPRNCSSFIRLFNFSSTSGCAVSRPIANSSFIPWPSGPVFAEQGSAGEGEGSRAGATPPALLGTPLAHPMGEGSGVRARESGEQAGVRAVPLAKFILIAADGLLSPERGPPSRSRNVNADSPTSAG